MMDYEGKFGGLFFGGLSSVGRKFGDSFCFGGLFKCLTEDFNNV